MFDFRFMMMIIMAFYIGWTIPDLVKYYQLTTHLNNVSIDCEKSR